MATSCPCGQPGSSSFASHWRVFATPTGRYHGRTFIRPSSPACATRQTRCLHTRKFGTLSSPPPPVLHMPWGPHLPGHVTVGQTLLTHRCRSSRINQEIVGVGNGFLVRYRIHPPCTVGRYLIALIGLYQNSSDRWFRLCALNWCDRSFQRCSVLATLSILVLPAILHHVSPTFALKTVLSSSEHASRDARFFRFPVWRSRRGLGSRRLCGRRRKTQA